MKRCFDGTHFTETVAQKLVAPPKRVCRNSLIAFLVPFSPSSPPMNYRFEAFELDTERFELRQDGKPVAIERQVLKLLVLLVQEHPRLVTKDEIHAHVWAGGIVSEAALSSRIRSARQAIGDDGKSQRLIRTVHSSGFRFVGDVESPAEAASASTPTPASGTMSRPTIAVLPFANHCRSISPTASLATSSAHSANTGGSASLHVTPPLATKDSR